MAQALNPASAHLLEHAMYLYLPCHNALSKFQHSWRPLVHSKFAHNHSSVINSLDAKAAEKSTSVLGLAALKPCFVTWTPVCLAQAAVAKHLTLLLPS